MTNSDKVTMSQSTVEVVSVPEDFQNFIVKGERICGMPSPSASFGDTGPSLSIATPATGQDSFQSGSVTDSSQNHGSSAYVADEILYRLCEIGISYQLSKEEMLDYYIQTLTLLVDVATSKDILPPESSSPEEARGWIHNYGHDHGYRLRTQARLYERYSLKEAPTSFTGARIRHAWGGFI